VVPTVLGGTPGRASRTRRRHANLARGPGCVGDCFGEVSNGKPSVRRYLDGS